MTQLSKGLQNVQYLSPQHQERDPGFTIVDPNDGSRIMSLGGTAMSALDLHRLGLTWCVRLPS